MNLRQVLLLCFLPLFSKAQEIQQSLDQLTSENKLVAITAGYYNKAETHIFSSGSNVSNETIYRIASITKPMTAVAIMQLAEKELLDLDAPIQTYLPDFPKKPEGEITTRMLLAHTSGLSEYKSSKESNSNKNYASLTEVMNVFMDRDLENNPGETFFYTTYGYVVLGAIIESVSGLNYGDYMKQHIWDKLGMEQTSVEESGTTYKNKAALYHRQSNGKIKDAIPTDLSIKTPGGGVQSSVGDLLRFGKGLLNNELITAESLTFMLTDTGMKKEGNPYGLGFYLYGENPNFGNVYGHNGTQIGSSGIFFILPDQNVCIAVLSNTSGALNEVFGIGVALFAEASE